MNIELLDEKRVLIDLCVDDMQLLSLEYKNLSMQSPVNRKIINNLVRIAKLKTGFQTSKSSTVFVEAMPYQGGCFILITLKDSSKANGKKYRVIRKLHKRVFMFNRCEEMLSAVEKLYPYKEQIVKSTLAFKDNIYYLLVHTPNNAITIAEIILSEFSSGGISGGIKIAHILEHSNIIAENNAIEKIGSALCKV
ncbi:MAG: adaptor protein MecA [Acutalibacteraceae bacterium]|nr:adaptor protein MecA [Acutalibacteraceae bacterium]